MSDEVKNSIYKSRLYKVLSYTFDKVFEPKVYTDVNLNQEIDFLIVLILN